MQRIEIPKGSKVTIEDGVILIESTEKCNLHPANGEIVVVEFNNRKLIAIYTNDRNRYNVACCYLDDKILTWAGGDIFTNHDFKAANKTEKEIIFKSMLDAGYRYNEDTDDVEKIRWEPNGREKYWSFIAAGVYSRINTLNDIDLFVINNGFAFKTQQEAQ